MQIRKKRALDAQELAQSIVDKFSMSQQWREPHKQKWDEYYDMYRGVLPQKSYEWQSNIYVPYPFSTVETLVPRLTAQKPQIDIMPTEPSDSDKAKVMNALIDYQWNMMSANVWMPEAVREMLIYGTVVVKVYWKTVKENVQKFEDIIDDPNADEEIVQEAGQVKIETEETTYDAPCVEVVDLYDFFVDPQATSIEAARYVIHRTWRTLEYLKQKQKEGVYKNIKLIENMQQSGSFEDDKSSRREAANLNDGQYYVPNNDMIEILEYWEDGRVVCVAGRSVVIRDEVNPYDHNKKIFVECVMIRPPHEFYGIGVLEPIQTLVKELNDRRNQRMDNVTLVLNKQFIIENGQNVDEDELISTPGGAIHADSITAVQVLQQGDVTSSSYQEETLIKADIQQTTGVSDFTQGVGSDSLGNDTATGISLIQEAGNARFKAIANNLEEMMIKNIGQMMVAMNLQYMDQEKVLRIVGDDGVDFPQVTPEEIRGNFDVVVKAGSTLPVNDAVEKKQTMEFYEIFKDNPNVNQLELDKLVAKKILPSANLEKLFTPPPQAPALQPEQGGQVTDLQAGNAPADIMQSAMAT